MNAFCDTFSTSFGTFSVALDDEGRLLATAFGPRAALAARLRSSHVLRDAPPARAVREQVLAYCGGDLRHFTLSLAAPGTPFQQRVWAALTNIPFGETRGYGELAAELGNPRACRAVGRANATNPLCLIVPCHRVIGRDGALTGFAFGEDLKRRLLEHERRVAARSCAA